MANWNDLSVSNAYATLVQSINDRDLDAAKGFDPAKVTVSNPKTDTIRWTSASSRWERYNGTAWVDLAASYAINISGNAATATQAGSASAVPWSGVSGKPTTVSGYGITDMSSQSVAYATSARNLSAGSGTDVVVRMNGGQLNYMFTPTSFTPFSDDTKSLGQPYYRWSTIYATNGTIQTSDAREKTNVRPLSEAEIDAAKELSAEIGAFKFLDAVEKKGNKARQHIGMTVQRAIEIMESHGLDPFAYGFICHDQWPSRDGHEAGDRYGFRPDELLLFIARGFEARLKALEDPR